MSASELDRDEKEASEVNTRFGARVKVSGSVNANSVRLVLCKDPCTILWRINAAALCGLSAWCPAFSRRYFYFGFF